MSSRPRTLALLACLAVAGTPGATLAKELVVGDPKVYEAGQNAFPFSTLPSYYGYANTRYQQVYGASAFGGGPIDISALVFYASGNTDAPLLAGTFDVYLSVTDRGVNEISGNAFDANLGFDTRLFATLSGGTVVTDGKLVINGSPFHYDPALGNLLLDLRFAGVPNGHSGPFFAALAGGSGPLAMPFSRWHDFGSGYDNQGLVTGFRSNVAEPGTLVLLCAGLAGLGLGLRAERRRRP